MSKHRFPSFNFPYTSAEDQRQFLVDYGRTGEVHVFKNGGKVECIPQKKENESKKMRYVSQKPALPLNLPDKTSEKLNFSLECKTTSSNARQLWDSEQLVTNLVADNGQIVLGGLAEAVSEEATKLSWYPPKPLPFSNQGSQKRFDPVLRRLESNFTDIPLGILTDFVQESCDQDKVTATGKYCGNCLGFSREHEELNAIYPHGTCMNDLCFSSWKIDSQDERSFSTKGSFSLPERISQISMARESHVIAVRTENKCWFFRNFLESEMPTFLGNLESKTMLCAAAISPYIPEVVVAMETGSLWLWNADDGSIQVVRQCSACSTEEFEWYFTEFGSHPRQVVRASQTNVELIDLRGGSSTSKDLMTLPSGHFFPHDKFTAMQHNIDNPYHYYLATTQALVIMDERFHQHPVLKWSHSLEYPPKYINVLSDPTSQDVLVFAGCYESHDVHCFQYCYGENTSCPLGMADDLTSVLPPRSTSSPWKVSSYNEWPEMIEYPNKAQSYPKVTERLKQPLLGISCIPHSASLTVVQLSNAGDLFYQTLTARESKLSEVREEGGLSYYEDFDLDFSTSGGCGSKKVKLNKNDEEFISQWVNCLIEHENIESKDMLESLDKSVTENVGLIRKALFSSLVLGVEIKCRLCSGEDLTNISSQETCLYCGLIKEHSEQLYNVVNSEKKVLTKQNLGMNYEVEALQLFDYDIECSEALGNILLRNWNSIEQEPIDLEGKLSTESENKHDTTIKWVETGLVTQSPARNEGESGNSTLKTKPVVVSPEHYTTATKKNTTSANVENTPRTVRQVLETKTFSPGSNNLARSSNLNKVPEDSTKLNNVGSANPSPVTPSQELRFENLRTPERSTNQSSQKQTKHNSLTPTIRIPFNSQNTPGSQKRTPVQKKITRVPGF